MPYMPYFIIIFKTKIIILKLSNVAIYINELVVYFLVFRTNYEILVDQVSFKTLFVTEILADNGHQ